MMSKPQNAPRLAAFSAGAGMHRENREIEVNSDEKINYAYFKFIICCAFRCL